MASITFTAPLSAIGNWRLVSVPKTESEQFSSRGMVMVSGTINDMPFQAALEPDGKGSHWLHVTDAMQKQLGAQVGAPLSLTMEQTKVWPEPELPADLTTALKKDAAADALWRELTPLTHWDWIRWIQATTRPETRPDRIATAFSKLKHGIRRPCCFNRSACTVYEVAKGGVLRDPEQ